MIGDTIRRRTRGTDRELLLDRHLPTFDVTQLRHVVVDATPEEAYAAVRGVDLVRIGLGPRLLNELRYLPARLLARTRGTETPETPESLTFGDLTTETGYVVLGEEFVLGAVGRFWQPEIEWADVAAEEFATFDRPGYAKLAIGVSVRPYGTDRSLVTYEARTATTDEASRRRFRRYWTLIGPFAGYLMGRVLETVRADLEGHTIEVE
jgi:hypothetical protein